MTMKDPISGELMDVFAPILFIEEDEEPVDVLGNIDFDEYFFDPTHLIDMEDAVPPEPEP